MKPVTLTLHVDADGLRRELRIRKALAGALLRVTRSLLGLVLGAMFRVEVEVLVQFNDDGLRRRVDKMLTVTEGEGTPEGAAQ
jgi:hypothetical protein